MSSWKAYKTVSRWIRYTMFNLTVFPLSFAMSAIPTPALTATPAPDATELANLKHKYTTLEAQHATVQGRLSKRQVHAYHSVNIH